MAQQSGGEIVTGAFEAFNRDGIEAVIDLFHPEFEFTVPPALSAEPDTYRGREGARRWFAGFDGYMEDVQLGMEQVEEPAPGTVAGLMRLTARGAESGIEVDQAVGLVVRLREERVRRIEVFPTREEALAAAAADR